MARLFGLTEEQVARIRPLSPRNVVRGGWMPPRPPMVPTKPSTTVPPLVRQGCF